MTFLEIHSSGSDRQFWAGDYGVKIAGTSVVVKLEFNERSDESEEEIANYENMEELDGDSDFD
jgi:hypothetical protein